MSELFTVHSWPELERPVLVLGLEGWIDAGFAAAGAVTALLSSTEHETIANFDADELVDYRARRPTLRIVNGVDTELRWQELRLELGTNRTGRSVLVLRGPEPDMRWHRFATDVVELASRLQVELVVGIGAFPAPVPHTRPVRLVGTSTDAALASKVGYLPASLDVPSGIQGVLEVSFGEAGIPAVGLWARVPHYVAAMPYPAASAALLEGLAKIGGLEIETSSLHTAAAATNKQIEQLVAASEEHTALIRQLEAQHDREQGPSPVDFTSLPTGDELAAELERYLRDQQ